MDAKEKLRIASMKIMTCKKINLFGAMYFEFNHRIIDDPELTAFVYFNGKEPNIVYGKQLIDKHNIKQLIAIILHEMLHFINGHHKRGQKYNRVIANMAADHVINEIIMKDMGLVDVEDEHGHITRSSNFIRNIAEIWTKPKPYVVEELLGKKNMTYEAVYEWLMKNKVDHVQISQASCSSCDGSGEQQDKNGNGTGKECPDCNGKGQGSNNGRNKYKVKFKGGKEIEYTPDIDDGKSDGDGGKEQDKNAQEASNDLKNKLRSIIQAAQKSNLTRGMKGSSLLSHIEELTKVVIPWEELLEISIKNHVIPSIENRSWKNPLKRMRSHGLTFPGMGTDTTASKMGVVIDTSGSVGDDDLKKFLSICKDSLIHFDEIVVIQHDYHITKITKVDRDNMETGLDDVSHFEGRGGTSHGEVFEYIENEMWSEDDEVGLVIMLTDFYSDVKKLWKSGKYNWIEEYPVKIVLNHPKVNMVPDFVDQHPIVIQDVE